MEAAASTLIKGCYVADDSLLRNRGIISSKGTYTFVNLENGLDSDSDKGTVICTLEGITKGFTQVVSLGHGLFGIGNQIYKFGMSNALCTIRSAKGNCIWQHINRALSETEFITVDMEPYNINNIIVRYYTICGNIATCDREMKTNFPDDHTTFNVQFFKDHILVINSRDICIAIDSRTCAVSDTLDLASNNNGHRFGTVYNCKFIENGKVFGIYSSTCTCPEPLLLGTLDIVGGKLVFTNAKWEMPALASSIKKAYKVKSVRNWTIACSFMTVPNIIHMNSWKMSSTSSEEEALVYLPTGTVLPITGKKINKNIEIIDMLTSTDGKCIALLVTTGGNREDVQLCMIETRTGKTENYVIRDAKSVILEYFTTGNKAIVYYKQDKNGNRCVMQQPIFSGRVDIIANKLDLVLNQQLPFEVVLNIAAFLV